MEEEKFDKKEIGEHIGKNSVRKDKNPFKQEKKSNCKK